MDPATKEYFQTFETLMEEVHLYKSEQVQLKFEISKMYEENKRLTKELKENVLLRKQQISQSGTGDMERQFQEALSAKNSAMEMWQEALRQLEKQNELLVGKKSIVEAERSSSGKTIDHIKKEFTNALHIMSTELSNYREELTSTKLSLQSKSSQLENCKEDFEKIQNELEECKLHESAISKEMSEMENKIKSLYSLLTETENFLTSSKTEITSLRTDNSELALIVSALKEDNKNLKNDNAVFEKDAKESLLTAQEAILRRKEIAYKEEQYLKEIVHLKSSVNLEAEKVTLKFKSELKDVQKQASLKVQSLMDELQALHQENSEKQNLFEKAVREKQALESKLDALFLEITNSVPSSGTTFDELCKRLTMAEKSRDEYACQVRSLQSDLKDLKSEKELEVIFMQSECSVAKEKFQKLKEDFQYSSSDRIKLSNETTKLKKRCYDLEKDLKFTRTRCSNEVSSLRQEFSQKQQMFSEKLNLDEDHYKKVCGELQKLLDAEAKISSQWRLECDDLVKKSESHIKELCDTITNLQNKNGELVNTLQRTPLYA